MASPGRIVVIGTGGTISSTAASADENVRYQAGAIGASALVGDVTTPVGCEIEAVEVAAIDSKDMDFATWQALAVCIAEHLARPEVCGIVVTHGTDTLEETAWFLQRVFGPDRPVVLTASMRPASSRQADGPQNLADALVVAAGGQAGVVAVLAGTVHSARDVRKRHPYRLDAFGSGDAGPLAYVEAGQVRTLRPWPEVACDDGWGPGLLTGDPATWPLVGIVTSTAGADARSVTALVDAGFEGLVVAATGNGTVHRALEEALRVARGRGVEVLRCTRCLDGVIVEPADGPDPQALPSGCDLTPQKARVELLLTLLARRRTLADAT